MQKALLQIVLDTNVLVSAFRSIRGCSHALVQCIFDDRVKINLSTALVLEYESALKREFKRQGRNLSEVDVFLDALLQKAIRRSILAPRELSLPDPSDVHVLELGIASRADYIVTYNLRDFAGAESFGMRVVEPRTVLNLLGD